MIKITSQKIIKTIKEKTGRDVVYMGRLGTQDYQIAVPRTMLFLERKTNKIVSLLESKLYDLLK